MSWYNSNWAYRVQVTVLHAKVTADQSTFPVFLDLSLLPANFHTNCNQTDARDIRITTSDGVTEVPREIVYYTAASDTGEVHFKGDLLTASDVVFYVYYGNPSASDYATNATFGAQNVWNSNYVLVHHGGSPSSIGLTDSTANANNISNSGLTAGTGQLGGAIVGNGTNESGSIADQASQKSLTALSVELWTKVTSFSPNTDGVMWVTKNVSNSSATDPYQAFVFFTDATGVVYFRVTNGVTAGSYAAQTVQSAAGYFTTGTWTYMAATYDATTLRLYKNGTVNGTTVTASGINTGTTVTTAMTIGNFGPAGFNYFLNGSMDEIRMSKVARSGTWISTQYNNQSSASTFFSVAAFEPFALPAQNNNYTRVRTADGVSSSGSVI